MTFKIRLWILHPIILFVLIGGTMRRQALSSTTAAAATWNRCRSVAFLSSSTASSSSYPLASSGTPRKSWKLAPQRHNKNIWKKRMDGRVSSKISSSKVNDNDKEEFSPVMTKIKQMEESKTEAASNPSTSDTNNPKPFFDMVDERTQLLMQEEETSSQQQPSIDPRSLFSNATSSSNSTSLFFSNATSKSPATNSMEYDNVDFHQYKRTMIEILQSQRFHKNKSKQEDIDAVTTWLLSPKRLLSINLSMLVFNSSRPQNEETFTQFRDELKRQREKFKDVTELTDKQYQLALRALNVIGDYCAKRMLPIPLHIAWEKIKEAGMMPREQAMNTYLYVVGNSVTTLLVPDAVEEEEEEGADDDIASEVALFHDLLYEPSEKSISLRVKGLVAKGDPVGAQALLDTQPPKNTGDAELLRLRTYLPVLQAYCDIGDCDSAFHLFYRMRTSPGVNLEPENYVLFLSTLAEHGYFSQNSKPIKGARQLGYEQGNGPILFNRLVIEMAENVLEINSASARRLFNAFSSNNHYNLSSTIPALAPLPVDNTTSSPSEMVVSRVQIDPLTATCPRTGAKLRLIVLSPADQRSFYEKLLQMACDQFQTFTSNAVFNQNCIEGDDHAIKELNAFANWLDTREGDPFTAIIDGANVAYFGQNFDHGRFSYRQIWFLAKVMEEKQENPLVILPGKYMSSSFYSNLGAQSRKQKLKPGEIEIMNRLEESGKIYKVPARCLDDYYWMLVSVSNQTTSRRNRDLEVRPNNDKGRWPGTRPILLTNDQMRDHKMELLEPRLFRRWTSSHIVNYNFLAFGDEEDDMQEHEYLEKEVTFSAPDFFSREIQGNPTYQEDGISFAGMAWHFPVKDWDDNERLCIRIPI